MLNFIGTTELLLIGGLALLLFGGKKLPEMMRGLGKGVREFKDGMSEMNISSDSHDSLSGEEYYRDEDNNDNKNNESNA